MRKWLAEVRPPDGEATRFLLEDVVEVGRDCDGVGVEDGKVSRRHLALTPRAGGVVVSDLDSTNGTFVNGARITEPTTVTPDDVVRLGDTEVRVTLTQPAAPSAAGAAAGDGLTEMRADGVVVRYRVGSAGERVARDVATAARDARKRLAGLGSEPWGIEPTIWLADPFPDPDSGELLTAGTVVDTDRDEIWMVVLPGTQPEPPERPLALLFGAALPAGEDLAPWLEAYGLHLAGAPDPDPWLRTRPLPPVASAHGELAEGMLLSFVRFLLAREGEDRFRTLLAMSRPGRLDDAAQRVYGTGLGKLESAWRQQLSRPAGDASLRDFVRLAFAQMRPHRRRQLEVYLHSALGLGFTLVFPFVFRALVDDALPRGDVDRILTLLGVLAAALVVSLLAGVRRAYLSAYVSASVVQDLRSRLFDHLQTLSPGWFDRYEQGDVQSRFFADVDEVEAGLSKVATDGVFQVLTLLVAGVVLLVLSPLLGGIVLVAAPAVALVYRRMSAGSLERSTAVQGRRGALLSVTSENYSAQPVVKAFGLERREGERFRRAAGRLFDAQVRMHVFGGLFTLSVRGIVTLLRLVVLALGVWLILRGQLTLGGLVAFMSIMGEVLAPVTELAGVGQQVQASTGALLRVNEVLDSEPDVADPPDAEPLPPLSEELRLQDVSVSYRPGEPVLKNVSCRIPAGARVAFVGPSGAGKSTVLGLLLRLRDPDEGVVRVDGRDLRSVTLASWREQVAVVFQDTFLFDTSLRENIRLGRPSATDDEVEEAARAAEADGFITEMPGGFDALPGEGGRRLSGGQRQRIAIARSLLRDPRLLLLDEATSALDPRTERLIGTTLERVAEGRTTVAVTHRLTTAMNSDRIFVLVGGELVEEGIHDELLARGGTYAGMWADQTGGRPPAREPFDTGRALSRVPLFADLGTEQLARVAARLHAEELTPGERLSEDAGKLVMIRRGRARVRVDGAALPSHGAGLELQPGDYFGLAAVLGDAQQTVLEALDLVELLVLDREVLAGLAAELPPVEAALRGQGRRTAGPAGGMRLSRSTLGPSVAVRSKGGAA